MNFLWAYDTIISRCLINLDPDRSVSGIDKLKAIVFVCMITSVLVSCIIQLVRSQSELNKSVIENKIKNLPLSQWSWQEQRGQAESLAFDLFQSK